VWCCSLDLRMDVLFSVAPYPHRGEKGDTVGAHGGAPNVRTLALGMGAGAGSGAAGGQEGQHFLIVRL
jgi:hypothetical protein